MTVAQSVQGRARPGTIMAHQQHDAVPELMYIKLYLTVDESAQHRHRMNSHMRSPSTLASASSTILVNTGRLREVDLVKEGSSTALDLAHEYGRVQLKTILRIIAREVGELVPVIPNSSTEINGGGGGGGGAAASVPLKDYSIYALDPYESNTNARKASLVPRTPTRYSTTESFGLIWSHFGVLSKKLGVWRDGEFEWASPTNLRPVEDILTGEVQRNDGQSEAQLVIRLKLKAVSVRSVDPFVSPVMSNRIKDARVTRDDSRLACSPLSRQSKAEKVSTEAMHQKAQRSSPSEDLCVGAGTIDSTSELSKRTKSSANSSLSCNFNAQKSKTHKRGLSDTARSTLSRSRTPSSDVDMNIDLEEEQAKAVEAEEARRKKTTAAAETCRQTDSLKSSKNVPNRVTKSVEIQTAHKNTLTENKGKVKEAIPSSRAKLSAKTTSDTDSEGEQQVGEVQQSRPNTRPKDATEMNHVRTVKPQSAPLPRSAANTTTSALDRDAIIKMMHALQKAHDAKSDVVPAPSSESAEQRQRSDENSQDRRTIASHRSRQQAPVSSLAAAYNAGQGYESMTKAHDQNTIDSNVMSWHRTSQIAQQAQEIAQRPKAPGNVDEVSNVLHANVRSAPPPKSGPPNATLSQSLSSQHLDHRENLTGEGQKKNNLLTSQSQHSVVELHGASVVQKPVHQRLNAESIASNGRAEKVMGPPRARKRKSDTETESLWRNTLVSSAKGGQHRRNMDDTPGSGPSAGQGDLKARLVETPTSIASQYGYYHNNNTSRLVQEDKSQNTAHSLDVPAYYSSSLSGSENDTNLSRHDRSESVATEESTGSHGTPISSDTPASSDSINNWIETASPEALVQQIAATLPTETPEFRAFAAAFNEEIKAIDFSQFDPGSFDDTGLHEGDLDLNSFPDLSSVPDLVHTTSNMSETTMSIPSRHNSDYGQKIRPSSAKAPALNSRKDCPAPQGPASPSLEALLRESQRLVDAQYLPPAQPTMDQEFQNWLSDNGNRNATEAVQGEILDYKLDKALQMPKSSAMYMTSNMMPAVTEESPGDWGIGA